MLTMIGIDMQATKCRAMSGILCAFLSATVLIGFAGGCNAETHVVNCALSTSTRPGQPSPEPLAVILMGDPQIPMVAETPTNVQVAMADILTLEHSFLAVLGDLVQNKAVYYDDYRKLVLAKAKRQVFSLAGNGDLGAGLEAYQRATGLPLYYAMYRRGIRFIFLSVTGMSGEGRHICHLGARQMRWLQDELDRDTTATTVIFSHAPIFETTFHSEDRQDKPFPGSMYLYESADMRKLFAAHSNIKVYASGHLHRRYGVQDEHGRGQYHKDGGVLHISVGATANNQGSVVLYVGSDTITAHIRDHASSSWVDKYEYVYRTGTTLRPQAEEVDDHADIGRAGQSSSGSQQPFVRLVSPAAHAHRFVGLCRDNVVF